MGGEGAMMAAINSLRNNRNLVSKRKERNALTGSYSHVRLKEFSSATPEGLVKLKERIQLENRENRIRLILVFIFAILILAFMAIYILK
jgi:hypothetical protein